MVSYRPSQFGNCGNQTFDTREKADEYVKEHHKEWFSYSVFMYSNDTAVAQLIEIVHNPDQKLR